MQYLNLSKRHLSLLSLIWMAVFGVLTPSFADPVPDDFVALVPLDLVREADENEPLGSERNPCQLMEVIRNPELLKPGVHVALLKPSGKELMVLPIGKKSQFSVADKWKHTKKLMSSAGWKLPSKLKTQSVKVNSIKVIGTASTYGRNDGFANQRTSSGRFVTSSTAALQMDLAHVLADMGVVPFSMRDVRATLTMPDGRQVAKRLEDKGGLVNHLGERYWRKAIKTMRVDGNGVGTLAPLPASHYRVVDIFTQRRSTLIPQVTVEIHLKKPLVRKAKLSPGQCLAWMQKNFKNPKPKPDKSLEPLPPFK